MQNFTGIIDDYLTNYSKYENGKVCFECSYGELIFIKNDSNTLTVHGIYIFPEFRKMGLCRAILHYLIDHGSAKFKYLCVQSVLSNILYEYLLRFRYKNKKFKNTHAGFVCKIKN